MALAPVLIKRYARSRLYDTASGRYVTIDAICASGGASASH